MAARANRPPPPLMNREFLSNLAPHLARRLAALCSLAGATGAIEAFILIAVVGATVSITSDEADRAVTLPALNSEISVPTVLLIAGVSALLLIMLHILMARLSASIAADVLATVREETLQTYASADWASQ